MVIHEKKPVETVNRRLQTMRTREIDYDWHQVNFAICVLDRPCFINDIADCIPRGDACQVMPLSFDASGNRLKAAPGMVCIQPVQNQ